MKPTKILDLPNDGLNMAADGQCLYIRCKREMLRVDLAEMRVAARTTVFKKDGKARGVSVCEKFIILTDFCDLHVLRKNDLQVEGVYRLGADASSDLGGVRFDARKAYIGVRNGKMAVMDIETHVVAMHEIAGASFWDHCVVGSRIFAGTVKGELIEIDAGDMRVARKTELHKKNIYSVLLCEGKIYTVSQDATLKIVDAASFETVHTAKKAVRGMARILGTYENDLVVFDSGQISLWDAASLQKRARFEFPAGAYGKGAALHGDRLYGSDFQNVYVTELG